MGQKWLIVVLGNWPFLSAQDKCHGHLYSPALVQ